MDLQPVHAPVAAFGVVVSVFLGFVFHGGTRQALDLRLIDWARVLWPRWIPEWDGHAGVRVEYGLFNESDCIQLAHEASLRTESVPQWQSAGQLHHERIPARLMCNFAPVIQAASHVMRSVTAWYHSETLRISEIAISKQSSTTKEQAQPRPLPWYTMMLASMVAWMMPSRVEAWLGESVARAYRWSINGDPAHADQCDYDSDTGQCTFDASTCCAWRTHSAFVFLNGPEIGGFTGGDFLYLDPEYWPTWRWFREVFGWVRIPAKCGTVVMFETRMEQPLLHSTVPIWPAGAASNLQRYVMEVWFTDVKDDQAAERFARFNEGKASSNFRDMSNWPFHRCLRQKGSYLTQYGRDVVIRELESTAPDANSIASASADAELHPTPALPIPQHSAGSRSLRPAKALQDSTVDAVSNPIASATAPQGASVDSAPADTIVPAATQRPAGISFAETGAGFGTVPVATHQEFRKPPNSRQIVKQAGDFVARDPEKGVHIIRSVAGALGIDVRDFPGAMRGEVLVRSFALRVQLRPLKELAQNLGVPEQAARPDVCIASIILFLKDVDAPGIAARLTQTAVSTTAPRTGPIAAMYRTEHPTKFFSTTPTVTSSSTLGTMTVTMTSTAIGAAGGVTTGKPSTSFTTTSSTVATSSSDGAPMSIARPSADSATSTPGSQPAAVSGASAFAVQTKVVITGRVLTQAGGFIRQHPQEALQTLQNLCERLGINTRDLPIHLKGESLVRAIALRTTLKALQDFWASLGGTEEFKRPDIGVAAIMLRLAEHVDS